ncbi:MAG TPA: gluconate 2-dehydrogenase subunit 3 family protein [Dongiaceae bacterium]|nr:gluconate 2-dehydrogenase subunit 3 family protein [Dongiaceae bacterium]
MSAAQELPVVQQQAVARRLSRREAVQLLFAAAAAGTIAPLSAAHPVQRHLRNDSLLDIADATLAGGAPPQFLSAAQLQSLDALCEAIIPGSRGAGSAAFIDLLLSVDTAKSQQEFSSALAAIDSAAQKSFSHGLHALSPAQMHRLLAEASAPSSPNLAAFNELKEWSVGAYYSSEPGMRELGWTPDRVFANFPGCQHPEQHT